jgi:quercetin dioxygenase-like cupin family protein
MTWLSTICVLSLGCGHTSTTARSSPPPLAIEGAAVRTVELPAGAGTGQPREVRVLVDEPALKLVTIVLRGGTLLPEHHAEVPVLIQVLHGAGTVTAGGQQHRLDPTHSLVLAAKVPHAVAPDAATDLVLLVHHLGRAGQPSQPEHRP